MIENELSSLIFNYNQINNEYLYHYSTYSALLEIIKTGSIRFSRNDLLNDKGEVDLIGDKKDAFYIWSLNKDPSENVHMWSMYGNPKDVKVRLSFKKASFEHINVDSFYDLRGSDIEYSTKSYLDIKNNDQLKMGSVIYINRKPNGDKTYKLKSSKEIRELDSITSDMYAGFLKYDVWKEEKEFRIILYSPCRYSRDSLGIKYVYMEMPNEMKEEIVITFNPWISDKMYTLLSESLVEYAKKYGFYIKCFKSKYWNTIKDM